MKLYLIVQILCEKIISLREGFCGLLVRSQGVAMLTHLQRSCSLLPALLQTGARRSTKSRVPAPLAGCAPCAHLGSLWLREDSSSSPHSLLTAPTGLGDALHFYLPAQKKTKSMVVLRTKVLTSDTFGYLPNAEHRGAMRDKRQIVAKQKWRGC